MDVSARIGLGRIVHDNFEWSDEWPNPRHRRSSERAPGLPYLRRRVSDQNQSEHVPKVCREIARLLYYKVWVKDSVSPATSSRHDPSCPSLTHSSNLIHRITFPIKVHHSAESNAHPLPASRSPGSVTGQITEPPPRRIQSWPVRALGLFVPDQDYSRQGTLVYLEAGKTFFGKPCYKLQTNELRISTRDALMQAHRWIPDTRISLNKLLLVAEHVFKSVNYAPAARNGKNFCVDATHTLYSRHSVGASSWAMQDVEENGVDISRKTLVLEGN